MVPYFAIGHTRAVCNGWYKPAQELRIGIHLKTNYRNSLHQNHEQIRHNIKTFLSTFELDPPQLLRNSNQPQ